MPLLAIFHDLEAELRAMAQISPFQSVRRSMSGTAGCFLGARWTLSPKPGTRNYRYDADILSDAHCSKVSHNLVSLQFASIGV